jgi:hypothetical protein
MKELSLFTSDVGESVLLHFAYMNSWYGYMMMKEYMQLLSVGRISPTVSK